MRTQKRIAVTLSAASILTGGPALAASSTTASALPRNENTAVARYGAASGALGNANLLQRCRWVRGRWVCDYGRDYGRDRGRDRSRDRGRDWDRDRGWDRGRDRDRGRDWGRDRDWNGW